MAHRPTLVLGLLLLVVTTFAWSASGGTVNCKYPGGCAQDDAGFARIKRFASNMVLKRSEFAAALSKAKAKQSKTDVDSTTIAPTTPIPSEQIVTQNTDAILPKLSLTPNETCVGPADCEKWSAICDKKKMDNYGNCTCKVGEYFENGTNKCTKWTCTSSDGPACEQYWPGTYCTDAVCECTSEINKLGTFCVGQKEIMQDAPTTEINPTEPSGNSTESPGNSTESPGNSTDSPGNNNNSSSKSTYSFWANSWYIIMVVFVLLFVSLVLIYVYYRCYKAKADQTGQ